MDAWTARVAAAAAFCASALGGAAAANAETLALGCSIGGQELSAPLDIDLAGRTVNTGKEVLSAEVNGETVRWREGGVLRTFNRSSYAVFRQLPDGSFFQIGTCRPLTR